MRCISGLEDEDVVGGSCGIAVSCAVVKHEKNFVTRLLSDFTTSWFANKTLNITL